MMLGVGYSARILSAKLFLDKIDNRWNDRGRWWVRAIVYAIDKNEAERERDGKRREKRPGKRKCLIR
jgi:hypothetical protein